MIQHAFINEYSLVTIVISVHIHQDIECFMCDNYEIPRGRHCRIMMLLLLLLLLLLPLPPVATNKWRAVTAGYGKCQPGQQSTANFCIDSFQMCAGAQRAQ